MQADVVSAAELVGGQEDSVEAVILRCVLRVPCGYDRRADLARVADQPFRVRVSVVMLGALLNVS